MQFRVKSPKNLWAGVFFIATAAILLWVSRDYDIGTAMAMELGYMPRLLCWILAGLGLIVFAQGFTVRGDPVPQWPWRPMLMVTAAMLPFAFAIGPLGFVVACILVVIFGAFAGEDIRFKELAVTAVLMAAMSVLIFIHLLGLPMDTWPGL